MLGIVFSSQRLQGIVVSMQRDCQNSLHQYQVGRLVMLMTVSKEPWSNQDAALTIPRPTSTTQNERNEKRSPLESA